MRMQTTTGYASFSTADLGDLAQRVAEELCLPSWLSVCLTAEVHREAEAFVVALRDCLPGMRGAHVREIRQRGVCPVVLTLLDLDDDLWYGLAPQERRTLLEYLESRLSGQVESLYEALVAAAYETEGSPEL